MAGDRRARRLIDENEPSQRTLDSPPSTPPPEPGSDSSELLEAPPSQHAAARLEERQRRWFRLRETVAGTGTHPSTSSPPVAESDPADPKA